VCCPLSSSEAREGIAIDKDRIAGAAKQAVGGAKASASWGYFPSGGLGLLVVILIVVLLVRA
jgi:hypothetical protein